MSSRSPYDTGSLGQPRRPTNVMPFQQYSGLRRFEAESEPPVTEMRSRPRVLVVEDDDDSLFALKNILRDKGYDVVEAWDGRQAMEAAENQNFDLVLLDLQLPKISGLGVVSRIREKPEFESLPIVVMTGNSPEEYRTSAIAAGCDDFLLKPLDFDRLDVVLDYYAPVRNAA